MTERNTGLEILRFLKSLGDKSARANYVGLQALTDHFDLSIDEIRDQMMLLENEGYVKGLRGLGGSSFIITGQGKEFAARNA